MTTYKEQQKNKMYYVLIKDGVPLGTFGNLKKISEFLEDEIFPSYWTLVRKKENPIYCGDYTLFKVKHH
jgi:hypothetical protein